jgi:DNA-binding phage protein
VKRPRIIVEIERQADAALRKLDEALHGDPADMGALLSAAVGAHCGRTGQSQADVARAAGLTPSALSRALGSPDARPSTVRALCRALGLRVALVRAKR